MAIKYFLLFAAAFLGGGVGLIAIVRSLVFSFSGTRPIWMAAALSIVTGVLAYAITFISHDLFTIFCLLALLFLTAGIVHMFLQQRYFKSGEDQIYRLFMGKLSYALSVICFVIVVLSALLYFTGREFTFFLPAFSSGLSFFLPLLVVQAFFLANRIPPAEFPCWQYPAPGVIKEAPEDQKDRLLVLAFDLAKKPTDTRRTNFRARAPEHIILGDLFYHFINDYNEVQSETPIQFADNQHTSFCWLFRIYAKWYQPERVLDPEKNLLANGIKENSIIICERIRPDFQ